MPFVFFRKNINSLQDICKITEQENSKSVVMVKVTDHNLKSSGYEIKTDYNGNGTI